MTDEHQGYITSADLLALGLTPRQLYSWTDRGLIRSDNPHCGHGHPRRYPQSEAQIVATMLVLAGCGLPPSVAAKAARDDGWLTDRIRIITVDKTGAATKAEHD